jgi:quercetin dioxygenase-like cupin family protein
VKEHEPGTTALGKDLEALAASAARQQGVLWALEGVGDLNANLVRFSAGQGVGEHANDEVDVVFVGVSGSGTIVVEGEQFTLEPGRLVFVPRGCLRATRSGSGEFAYLTVHRRRGPLRIGARVPEGAGSADAG